MKLATFTHQGSTRIGVVVDDAVVDLAAAAPELPREMSALLAAGAGAIDRARAAATRAKTDRAWPGEARGADSAPKKRGIRAPTRVPRDRC